MKKGDFRPKSLKIAKFSARQNWYEY